MAEQHQQTAKVWMPRLTRRTLDTAATSHPIGFTSAPLPPKPSSSPSHATALIHQQQQHQQQQAAAQVGGAVLTRHQRKLREVPAASGANLRDPDCLDDLKALAPDKLLGKGDYGSIWSLKSPTGAPSTEWILKVSDLDGNKERVESFEREVYFLKRLQSSGVVPVLKMSRICNGQGVQLMERFDSSFQDMGQKQAQELGLPPKEVALTQEQIDNVVDLVKRFDAFNVLHGDLKRANILQSNSGQRVVVADFGFTGARDSPYYPLLGFVRNYKCPAEVVTVDGATKLKTSVPKALVPYLNRWEIYTDFAGGRRTYIIPTGTKGGGKTKKLKELDPVKLAKALGIPRTILHQFRRYCADSP